MYQTIILFVVIGIDKSLPVCRGTWFTGSASLTTWQPLSEEDSVEIEHSHQTILMSMVSQSTGFIISCYSLNMNQVAHLASDYIT